MHFGIDWQEQQWVIPCQVIQAMQPTLSDFDEI